MKGVVLREGVLREGVLEEVILEEVVLEESILEEGILEEVVPEEGVLEEGVTGLRGGYPRSHHPSRMGGHPVSAILLDYYLCMIMLRPFREFQPRSDMFLCSS